MSDIKKVTKIWASWNSEKIEAYLEHMEAQGWNLIAIKKLGYRMHFKKGEPRKISYCVDYQNKKSREYENLCRETGWKCEMYASGWYVWSKPYTDERPAIYTDVDSLIERNKRLSTMLVVVMCAQVPIFMVNASNNHIRLYFSSIYVVLFGLLLYGIYQLNQANKKLREKSKHWE